MIDLGPLIDGFGTALTPYHLALMVGGVLLGILVGVLPGLGAPNGVTLLLPLTFSMEPISGIIVLSSMYWGALFGGSTTSILFNIPGEPSSVATTFDGYPLAKQGRAAEALATAFMAAGFGALAGVVVVTLIANSIAGIALRFSAPEYFAVYLLAFCSFIGMGGGHPVKTGLSLLLGLALAAVGFDAVSGEVRLTFGSDELVRGIPFLVAVIGLFGIGEILVTVEQGLRFEGVHARVSLRDVWTCVRQMPRYCVAAVRSTVIGCWMGITPGGPTAASFMSYGDRAAVLEAPGELRTGRDRRRRLAGGRGSLGRRLGAAADAGARRAGLGDRGGDDGRADDLGAAAGPAAVRRAAGVRLGADRVDVRGQCRRRRPRAGDGAALRVGAADSVLDHRPADHRHVPDRRLHGREQPVRRRRWRWRSASSATCSRSSIIQWRRWCSRWCSATAPRWRSGSR